MSNVPATPNEGHKTEPEPEEEYMSPDKVFELMFLPGYATNPLEKPHPKAPPAPQEVSEEIFAQNEPLLANHIPALTSLFKALGDTTRLEILAILQDYEATPGHLALTLELSPSNVTHHLNLLKQAELVALSRRIKGRRGVMARHYTLTSRAKTLLEAGMTTLRA